MPPVMIAPSHLVRLQAPFLTALLDAGYEVTYPARAVQMTEADVLANLPGIEICLAGSEPYTRKTLEALPDLKLLARAGVGYDNIDVAAATDLGILVTYAPGSNHEAVGEHCFMLMLNLARNFLHHHTRIFAGEWPRHAVGNLRGKTLGLVGLGRTGKNMATRAKSFGMSVVASEPAPDLAFIESMGVKLASLEEVMSTSDFVSFHVPATPLTRKMVDRVTLGMMKPTAFLINASRGVVVNEDDLYEVLKAKRIAGAALDVFDKEPPGHHKLFTLDNLIATAHVAGVDFAARDNMALFPAQTIVRIGLGEWPEEMIVNPEVRDRWQARWNR